MNIFVGDIVKLTLGGSVKVGKIAKIDGDLVLIGDKNWYTLGVYQIEVLFSESSGIGNPLVDTA